MILTDEQRELLDIILETDGAELMSPDWRVAGELKRLGLITLSGPRGPGAMFRRAEVLQQEPQCNAKR